MPLRAETAKQKNEVSDMKQIKRILALAAAALLGSAYTTDSKDRNKGYPLLLWEDFCVAEATASALPQRVCLKVGNRSEKSRQIIHFTTNFLARF